jgi:N6-adenosine-specific RNA methylase IME4
MTAILNNTSAREFHPLANVFPLLDGEEFAALAADIAEYGVRESVVLFEDKILDGRNRARAAQAAGVDCPLTTYDGDDPAAFVVSLNLHRRHLNESQRALAAAKLVSWARGGNQHTSGSANLPTHKAAEMLKVSERSVTTARVVRDKGASELQAKVEQGRVSVSAAADVATLPKQEQSDIVARGEREILEAAKLIRAGKALKIRELRIAKLAEISMGNRELGTETRYPVIYADPPWRYEDPSKGGSNRSIENHYPTMLLDDICGLPVRDLATDDAILYLWVTAPKLFESAEVIEAWGFEYRTCMAWDKCKIGMGYWTRNQHELLLICTRGHMPTPMTGNRPPSVIRAPRTGHSVKPTEFYEIVETAYPELPKIELFCRSPRAGWAVWGNQAGRAA